MSTSLRSAGPLLPAPDGEAEVGERLTVLDLTTSGVRDYRLVAADPAHATEDEVSIRTLLGSALLGSHVGDVVTVQDGDRTVRLEIVEIDG